MRGRGPFARHVLTSAAGVTLVWPRYAPDARYCGRYIPWPQVRDASPPDIYPQAELRLRNGRTVFIGNDQRAGLGQALQDAGVVIRDRPDVWVPLLKPFTDEEYDEAERERCEGRLYGWGFTDEEIHAIRRRVRVRMRWMNGLYSEGYEIAYGHADLLLASCKFPPRRYLAFRAWAETIAARADTPAQ